MERRGAAHEDRHEESLKQLESDLTRRAIPKVRGNKVITGLRTPGTTDDTAQSWCIRPHAAADRRYGLAKPGNSCAFGKKSEVKTSLECYLVFTTSMLSMLYDKDDTVLEVSCLQKVIKHKARRKYDT